MNIFRLLVIGATVLMIGGWGGPAVLADFIHVPASEFNVSPSRGMYMWGQLVYKTDDTGYLTAPVHLPHGSVIKNIRVFYHDNHYEFITVSLIRHNQFILDREVIFFVETQGEVDGVRSSVDSTCSPAPSYRRVYNNVCQYYLQAYFSDTGSDLMLYGVSIEYE